MHEHPYTIIPLPTHHVDLYMDIHVHLYTSSLYICTSIYKVTVLEQAFTSNNIIANFWQHLPTAWPDEFPIHESISREQ